MGKIFLSTLFIFILAATLVPTPHGLVTASAEGRALDMNQMQNMGSYRDYYQGLMPDQIPADTGENYAVDISQFAA
jgi:hypothetical protein